MRSTYTYVTMAISAKAYEEIKDILLAAGYNDRINEAGEIDMHNIGIEKVPEIMKCTCCGTTENLHRDLGSGGPYRCNKPDCIVY